MEEFEFFVTEPGASKGAFLLSLMRGDENLSKACEASGMGLKMPPMRPWLAHGTSLY